MAKIQANGISIEYESLGSETNETFLLIMGLGAQLTSWNDLLKQGLVQRGYRVISFDSRDCGLSSRLGETGLPDFDAIEAALEAGAPPPLAYSTDDMAKDAISLLDALGIAKAHLVGASMGGMIAQLIAADYPDRVLSLTSMMAPAHVGKPDPASMAAMTAPLAPGVTLELLADTAAGFLLPMTSPGYPITLEALKAGLLAGYQRSHYPEGFVRQTAAAYADRSRGKLKTIKAPTLILHGEADQLAPAAGAAETADAIPGAKFDLIPGWGHDMPADLMPLFVEKIAANAAIGSRAAAAHA